MLDQLPQFLITGVTVGSIYTRDGRLVATAVQEGLMHLRERDD